MKNTKVTVVMPVLNGMPYFKEALDSVRNQSLKELEILVIDAGSADGTSEYVQECAFDDSRIKLIKSEKKSMGVQYNLGIANASGQYVGFCESDDYLASDMMEVLYETALKNDMPDTVKSNYYLFIRDGLEEYSLFYQIIPKYKKSQYKKTISLENNGDIYLRDFYMWYGIYRRDFLVKNGIALNETPGAAFQDGGFVQQVNMLADRQIYLKEGFYHYRRDNVNSSVYKKETSLFSLWEGKYIVDWLSKNQGLVKKYGCTMLERMVGQFFVWLYIKDIYLSDEISYTDDLQEFRKSVLGIIDQISYPERTRLLNNQLVFLLLYDIDGLNSLARIVGKIDKEKLCKFRDYMSGANQVVIVTAGEIGQSICAFLLRNKWGGEIVFCDNNEAIQGEKRMQRDVISFSDAVKRYPDAMYIVNPALYDELYFGLISQGVSANQIALPPFVDMHTCTGTDWK